MEMSEIYTTQVLSIFVRFQLALYAILCSLFILNTYDYADKAGVRAQRKEREKKLGTLREERLETVRIAISNTERHVPKVSGGKVSFKSPTAQNSPEERTSCYEEDSEDDNDCSFGPLSDSPAEEHADSVLEQISSFLTLSPSSPT